MPAGPAHLLEEGESLFWWATGHGGRVYAITSHRALAADAAMERIDTEVPLAAVTAAEIVARDDGTETLRFAPVLPDGRATALAAMLDLPLTGLKLFEFTAISDGLEAYRALEAAHEARTGGPLMI